jgi:hypothetical protein
VLGAPFGHNSIVVPFCEKADAEQASNSIEMIDFRLFIVVLVLFWLQR